MISRHLFFWPVMHLMPYWGIFPLSIEICRFSLLRDRPQLRVTHESSGQTRYIWCHTGAYGYGDDRSLTDLLQLSSLDRGISYLLHGSLFWRYSSRWAFIVAGCSSCDCLTIRDSSVDYCIEITWVTLLDHFSRNSLEDHSVWSFRFTSEESFETYGVSFRPFRWIESYATCHTAAYFPPSFLCSLAFKASVPS